MEFLPGGKKMDMLKMDELCGNVIYGHTERNKWMYGRIIDTLFPF